MHNLISGNDDSDGDGDGGGGGDVNSNRRSSGGKGGGIVQVVRLVMATVCRELILGWKLP